MGDARVMTQRQVLDCLRLSETGLGDASPHMLELVVAASLLARTARRGTTMRILVVHNRYRPTAPSGENAVVDQEASALTSRGHEVVVFERRSVEIGTWSPLRRATLPARLLWSETSRRAINESLARFAPDIVHIHNTFPLVTASVLYACGDAWVPVVVTVYREETFGMVAVEARAAGTAPVTSAHGAFPELLTHGYDGALFPPTDVDALVDILSDIDDNPSRWDGYGQQGRKTYAGRFSPDAGVARSLEIYRFALEHPIEWSDRSQQTGGRSGRSQFEVPS
jgi:Glycosyl transferases group 1